MFELENSRSGVETLKYNNRYIHSKYNPMKEAEQFAQGNKELINKEVVVLYGLGLGYHVESIHNLLLEGSILYVFEGNPQLITYCKKVNPKVFEYDNVKIIDYDNKFFYKKFSDVLNDVDDIIVHKPSLETIYKSNEILYNLINDFHIIKQQHESQPEMILQAEDNLKANKHRNTKNILEFINSKNDVNKIYVITASGPSLDYDLNLLKANQKKFHILAVGSALRTLVDNGIKPDCVVIIDPREIVKKQFEEIDCSNIPLCFDGKASRWAVQIHNGQKYIFNDDLEDDIIIRTSGTVAVAAMDIAIKCKAEKIILLGQDLAFIGEKSHTNTFEKTYVFKDSYRSNLKNKYVKGVDGRLVKTTQGYITFKNKIESLIRNNNNVEFINCSHGAFIEGAKHIEFYKVIDKVK